MKFKKFLPLISYVIVMLILFFMGIIFLIVYYPLKYKDTINHYCNLYGIDNAIVASVIFAESRFNPLAVSTSGAKGLMQIMPLTAEGFCDSNLTDIDLFNYETNIQIGCKYLDYLFDKYTDLITVLACYNAGEKVVAEWRGKQNKLYLNQIKYRETYNYVQKVLKACKFYKLRF